MEGKFSEFSKFGESDKTLNSSQFKDRLSYLYVVGSVVASSSLTQEAADLNNPSV